MKKPYTGTLSSLQAAVKSAEKNSSGYEGQYCRLSWYSVYQQAPLCRIYERQHGSHIQIADARID